MCGSAFISINVEEERGSLMFEVRKVNEEVHVVVVVLGVSASGIIYTRTYSYRAR